MPERLSTACARELLDFTGGDAGGVISRQVAEEQLRGAVAIHNLLTTQNVAYLADEVGMGKTYVALGAVALFRHFDPKFRVLVIAPRENIQDKWIREWRNFVRHIVRLEDLRVKGIGGDPARALVKAATLADLASKVSRDHDRDFFARLTSFSLPTSLNLERSEKPRNELLRTLPWLDPELLSARSKELYKRNFGRALNCALPEFDLVIIDEGHNLKHGWRPNHGATRNLVLGCALGGKDQADAIADGFRGYAPKAKRCLFLSATPIEHDFRQLWNQLDLLGFGEGWNQLADPAISDDEKREVTRALLVRRVGTLRAGEAVLTKNQYRREWRRGGAKTYDEPMAIPDDRQKLTVALVQKKVAEVLGSAKHNHSFQVGLLASFESFAETARIRQDAPVTEEGAEQETEQAFYTHPTYAREVDEREGMDVDAVNAIARDYLLRFQKSLPHPKMDALVDQLTSDAESGRKALVFVRRVASVDEIQRKLEERYDEKLFKKLGRELRSPKLRDELQRQIDRYLIQRSSERHSRRAVREIVPGQKPSEVPAESSNSDSFFAWFFRGDGPTDVLSGARLATRFDQVSGEYATFFEDNYVAAVLGVAPSEVFNALAVATQREPRSLRETLGAHALRYLRPSSKTLRLETYRAFQRAALDVLSESPGDVGEYAKVIVSEVFAQEKKLKQIATTSPDATEWLSVETLFTSLRAPARTDLRQRLWPSGSGGTIRERFRELELRRLLFATMARKGHPIIDLFVIVANRLGTLALRKREDRGLAADDLATQFLTRLDEQRQQDRDNFTSYFELAEAASNFALILTQNAPTVRERSLNEAPTVFGRLLGSQRPIGGMAGAVNSVLVRQFRMPGYPLVLVSTDLLQEGEDLHTFCSSVYHYGIAWMPSALEQRVGRVDRVGSQTERRLAGLASAPAGADKLQVYYPHLRETVEVLQVNRVLHRLNRFLRLMHRNLGLPEAENSAIDVKDEMLRAPVEALPIDEPLESAFDVSDAMLRGRTVPLGSDAGRAERSAQAFREASQAAVSQLGVRWSEAGRPHQRFGMRTIGERVQPVTLLMRSIRGMPVVRCVSPVGQVRVVDLEAEVVQRAAHRPFVRVSLVHNEKIDSYELAVEGDVLIVDLANSCERIIALVRAVTEAADSIEKAFQPADPDYQWIAKDMPKEADVER